MQTRALIVDDEAPAREELRHLLREMGEIPGQGPVRVVGEATDGEEALLLLDSLDYGLVFLDISMPGLSGLEIAARLAERPHRPQVIFTTAYPEHAVEAFDLAAADYLVKPFDTTRLRRAVLRALNVHDAPEPAEPSEPATQEPAPAEPAAGDRLVRIPVQRDGRTVLLPGDSIVYASAERGYSQIKLAEEAVLVSFSLNELERRLGGHFFRAHRSHLVNLRYVRELRHTAGGTLVLVMNDRQRSRVEVSRRHVRALRQRLGV
ncbi:LytR/AlgR family response regulator transcription factor [Nesterenkonia aerolata]|uniref:LytTR family DNA-binding domain-containing protein n=1 Tax=Nesterenkonia aerolata TaxID=3074079 RepID=A0ABU2DUX5_9MICC|nr:LytTR family DNA-binding domain-containing protein [Nesterenkonia sp. LY-0111]MDR8020318.1 LytTR family DNA-binding domain-containing protein [Nesterenkonia sp. LY-0111]